MTAVIARGADTSSTRCVQTSGTNRAAEAGLEWAVVYSPPGRAVYAGVRPCESRGHAEAVSAGLPQHYLPAYVVQQRDGVWEQVSEFRS